MSLEEVQGSETPNVLQKTNACKPKIVKTMFEDLARELSEIAKVLEEWGPVAWDENEVVLDRKRRLKKKLKKTNKRLKKLNHAISLCNDYHTINIPTSLIRHVDSGGSPYSWLQNLVKRVEEETSTERGEVKALHDLYQEVIKKTHVQTISNVSREHHSYESTAPSPLSEDVAMTLTAQPEIEL